MSNTSMPQPPKLKVPMKKEVAQGRHTKALGIVRRMRRGDNSLLQRIYELGNESAVLTLKHKPEELKQSLAFREHQQKLMGAIGRFKNSTSGTRFGIPHRVEVLIGKNAAKCIDEAPDQRKRQAARKEQNAFNKRGRETDQAKLNRDFKQAAKPPYTE